MTYARNTDVSPDRTQLDIQRTLRRYGATAFAYGWQGDDAQIQFELNDRVIRFQLRLPGLDDVSQTETGRARKKGAAEKALEQLIRQRWRALLLVVKAKLEAVETNISTFEEEFLAWTVLPDGSTVAQHLLPALDKAITKGQMPRLALPGPTRSTET